MSTHVCTIWERMSISDATSRHLKLGAEDRVWSRMCDGLAIFLVLQPGVKPKPNDDGYVSLDSALSMKGLRARQ